MTARYLVGDVFDGLATLDDDSADLIMSSPPFLALRSYLPADHPDKDREIGSEATPADFLDVLLDVVEACDRVLALHGSLVFELGDTYAGSTPTGGDWKDDPGEWTRYRRGSGDKPTEFANRRPAAGWPLDKSLSGIPALFASSLAYGRNLLRPERLTPPWRIRNLVPWARANPPVGALGDKWRPATSYLTVATKSRSRYCDLDAVRGIGSAHARTAVGVQSRPSTGKAAASERGGSWASLETLHDSGGAPPLDWWTDATAVLAAYFSTLGTNQRPSPTAAVRAMIDAGVMEVGDHLLVNAKGYAGAHYAVYPPELVVPFVECYCPLKVCRVCGEPSRRITSEPEYVNSKTGKAPTVLHFRSGVGVEGQGRNFITDGRGDWSVVRVVETLGFTDCGHDDMRPGVVLDCFAGSGTTLAVATGHGRHAIGIDLDSRNAELALERVGPMFLEIEHVGRTQEEVTT